MSNQYVNKIIIGNETKLDLTADTVIAAKLLSGYTAHDQSGAPITGTCNFDANTQDANALVAEVLATKTFYARGAKLAGTMPNNGAVSGVITTKTDTYSPPMGFHDGSGVVAIATAEQNKIAAGNIKSGVEILGVTGTYTGAAITSQTKSVTPTMAQQTVQPDTGYDYLSSVVVAAIPVVYTDNAAGGQTLTIG